MNRQFILKLTITLPFAISVLLYELTNISDKPILYQINHISKHLVMSGYNARVMDNKA